MERYTIQLSQSEIEELQKVVRKGSRSTQSFKSALILLNCDKGAYSHNNQTTTEVISDVLQINARTVERVKKRFMEGGLDQAITRRPTPRIYRKKMDGDLEAKLVALACSDPPAGRSRWTLRLLADRMVELSYIDYISHVTVGETLKKTNLNRGA